MTDFAIDSKGILVVSSLAGVFDSFDGGRNWTYIGPYDVGINSVAVDSLGYVYASNQDGIYRTLNPVGQ